MGESQKGGHDMANFTHMLRIEGSPLNYKTMCTKASILTGLSHDESANLVDRFFNLSYAAARIVLKNEIRKGERRRT